MNQRIHAFFSGEVQGVGFRFTARSLANQYRVKGWVKNTGDGKVELIAEGPRENVDNFIIGLNQEFKRNVTDLQIKRQEYGGEYRDFIIRF